MIHLPESNPEVERARFGPGETDRFVGFWLMLVVTARQGGMQRPRQIRRVVQELFDKAEVRAALDVAGAAALHDHLEDAAAAYWVTCQNDPQYSSKMLGMGRLRPQDVERKAARELVTMLIGLVESDSMHGPAEPLGDLVVNGFLKAFGDDALSLLYDAGAKHPAIHRFYS